MVALLVIVVITISLVAGLTFGITSLIKSGEVSLGIQKTQTQMVQISLMVRNSVINKDGVTMVPVNFSGGAVTDDMPSFIPLRRTAYNKKITYCAVASEGEAGAYVVENEDGRNYAVQGAPSGLSAATVDAMRSVNIVAYLVAPAPNNNSDMKCDNVSVSISDTLRLSASGGFVTPVYAAYGAEGGYGEQVFNVDTDEGFNDALNSIGNNRPTQASINLGSDVVIDASSINNITNNLYGRTLRIVGNGIRTISFSGSEPINITGHVKIENVSMVDGGPRLNVMEAGTLEVVNAETSVIATYSGRVILGQNAITHGTAAASPLIINGGNVSVSPSAILVVRSPLAIDLRGGTVFVSGTPRLLAAAGSSMVDAKKAIRVIGGGRITGDSSTVSFNVQGATPALIEINPLPRVGATCTSASCVVSCDIYGETAKVQSGTCSSAGAIPLVGTSISDSGQDFTCRWSIEPAMGESHRAEAMCAY